MPGGGGGLGTVVLGWVPAPSRLGLAVKFMVAAPVPTGHDWTPLTRMPRLKAHRTVDSPRTSPSTSERETPLCLCVRPSVLESGHGVGRRRWSPGTRLPRGDTASGSLRAPAAERVSCSLPTVPAGFQEQQAEGSQVGPKLPGMWHCWRSSGGSSHCPVPDIVFARAGWSKAKIRHCAVQTENWCILVHAVVFSYAQDGMAGIRQ